jgi:long-subunit fatty acid transport protein
MKKGFKVISKSLLFLLVSSCIAHGWSIFPNLGEERVGTSSVTFLKIGVGARAEAMGGSFVAMADDGTCLFYNPAGMELLEQNQVVFTHTEWAVDIKHEFFGYVQRLGDFSVGFSFIALHTEDMPVTDEYHPYGTGEYFSYADFAGGLSFSYRFTRHFTFGLTAKYVQENLDDLRTKGLLLDLGTSYYTGLAGTRFAVVLRNFGPQLGPGGSYSLRTITGEEIDKSYQKFSPPTLFTIGFAFEPWQSAEHRLTTSSQLNHPTDNAESFALGLEYAYNEFLMLRSGYKLNVEEENFSLGAGVKLKLWDRILAVDYSYTGFSYLGNSNRFTAVIGF